MKVKVETIGTPVVKVTMRMELTEARTLSSGLNLFVQQLPDTHTADVLAQLSTKLRNRVDSITQATEFGSFEEDD